MITAKEQQTSLAIIANERGLIDDTLRDVIISYHVGNFELIDMLFSLFEYEHSYDRFACVSIIARLVQYNGVKK